MTRIAPVQIRGVLLHRLGRVAVRAASALALLALAGGIPAGLCVYVGWPLPHHLPTSPNALEHLAATPITDTTVIDLLACALWILWAAFCYSLTLDIAAASRHQPARTHRLLSPIQALTALLILGLTAGPVTLTAATGAAVTPLPPPAAVAAAHPTSPTPDTAAASRGSDSSPSAAPPVTRPGDAPCRPSTPGAMSAAGAADDLPRFAVAATGQQDLAVAVSGQRYTVTVHPGDTLWDIAAVWLHDPNRWPEIYHLNAHRYDQNGRMQGGNHIEPDWVLQLPDDATPPPDARPTTPPAAAAPPADVPTAPPDSPSPQPSTSKPSPSHGSTTPAAPPSKTRSSPGVTLNDGWIPITLAAALAAAAGVVWLRRRHRYTPKPLSSTTADDPDLTPLPPAMNRVRHAVRHQTPEPRKPSGTPQPTVADYTTAINAGQHLDLPPTGPSGPQLAGFGDRTPIGRLSLIGPGAEPAARGLLVATLSAGSPDDPDAQGHVIIPADTLTTLLGTDAVHVGSLPRLQVTANFSEALLRAEELLIQRRRLLHEDDAADLAELRDRNPYHPPMPPVLLIADIPPTPLQARLTTTVHLGGPLEISAILLGDWPGGETLTVAADGHTTGAPDDRLAVLDIPTTLTMLEVLREAHTGQPNPAPPVEAPHRVNLAEPPSGNTSPPHLAEANSNEVHVEAVTEPDDVAAHGETPAQSLADTPSTTTDDAPDPDAAASISDAAGTEQTQPFHRNVPVRVQLLGEPAILDRDGNPVPGLRLHARELLVYLAVHRSGANLSDIMEAFWPNATVRRASQRLSTEAADLRRHIRQAAGDKAIQPIVNTGSRYHLNPDLIDVDVWRFVDTLRQAATAADPSTKATLLRHAIEADSRGPLARGHDYDWIDQPREKLRRYAIQVRLELADLLAADQPRAASDLVQEAATLDPINEALAQRAMRALAGIGDTDGVRAVLQGLRESLEAIDEEPADETVTLASDLQRQTAGDERRLYR